MWQPLAGWSGRRKLDNLQSGVAPLTQALPRPTCKIEKKMKKKSEFPTLTRCFAKRYTRSRDQVAPPLISPDKDVLLLLNMFILYSNFFLQLGIVLA